MTISTFKHPPKHRAQSPSKTKRSFCRAANFLTTAFGSHLLLALIAVPLFPAIGHAGEANLTHASEISQGSSKKNPAPTATVLPPIMVHGQREPLTESSHNIDRTVINNFPLGNGSLNDILSFLPDIQYSELSNLSSQGGEILPPAISISGGKSFENNFLIDGLSNNSLLDPDADTPISFTEVPGHAQEIFLDASLVENITVYDSNVPASYGDFKGGVVHATTIDPRHQLSGNLSYRTTRDSWTRFHIASSEQDEFNNSEDHNNQPKFEKHQTGFDIHIPYSSRLRLLGSYRLLLSTIPLHNLGETHNQHRRRETFLVKLAYEPAEQSKLNLSWTYSPYQGKYFKKDFRNSDFTIFGGAYVINADYHTTLSFAKLHIQAGYTESENSREGPTNMVQTQNPDKTWDREGFIGDIENLQRRFQWKSDLAIHPTVTGPIAHEINLGAEFQYIAGTSRRDETSYLYTYYSSGTANRKVYDKYQTDAILRQYNLYAEDILHYRRFELRPGLRISYDDFMENLNLAPRLAAAVDIFGNGNTVFIGGINRYYANTLLTYKLREGIPLGYFEDLSDNHWVVRKPANKAINFDQLKSPFADEYVLGLEQKLLGGKATFQFIQRNGKDEFATTFSSKQPDGMYYYSLNNNGRSRHQSYRLSWERQWRRHYLSINGTYQESTSSNESYTDLFDDEDLDEEIWYNGQAIPKSQLPRTNFNRPWLVNLLYVGHLPHNFTFSSLIKYRSGYQTLEKSRQSHPDLGIPIYEKTKLGGAATINCKIDWHTRLWTNQKMLLSVEILNLLDKKSAVGEQENGYEMGRQFWLGAQYFF